MITPEERQDHYAKALTSATEELYEMEKQIKKMGTRLRDLQWTIKGLCGLIGLPTPNNCDPGGRVVVFDPEHRPPLQNNKPK